MLGRLVLIFLQGAGAWFGAMLISRYIPLGGDLKLFAMAAIFAVLVWVIGLVAFEVIKDIWRPSSGALLAAIICALIGAAIKFVPGLPFRIDPLQAALVGALIGYQIRR